ncbi:MAG: c-type cytochrome [Deltaproteobacteria bacterium]|nr:c-type cytochrome [Deltaproteobacteria bacterium]
MTRARIAVACLLAAVTGALAGSAAAEDLARGEALYGLCAQCHGSEATGSKLAEAPSLAGLPQWYMENQLHKFQDRTRGEHPGDITGLRMAPMSRALRSDEDLSAVAAYIASLPAHTPEPLLVGGDAARGKEFFSLTCVACHGADAMGNQQMSSPPLRYASDWYLYRSLEKFRAGIRGANPADTVGATMRPMAMTLPDEQAMKDVIAYIHSLSE